MQAHSKEDQSLSGFTSLGGDFFVEIERVVGLSLMGRDFIPTEGMAMPQEGREPR